MLKMFNKLIFSIVVFFIFTHSLSVSVKAQNSLCDYFPFVEVEFLGFNTCTGGTGDIAGVGVDIGQNIRFWLGMVFIGIITFAIYQIIRASLIYIQSQGSEEKIGEAVGAVKAVIWGVGLMFVGIIGVVFVVVLFNATSSLEVNEVPGDDLFRGIQRGLQQNNQIQPNCNVIGNCPDGVV